MGTCIIGSEAVFVAVYDGPKFLHDLFVRDGGSGISKSCFDLGAEPRVISDGVFRTHKMGRRVEIGVGEGVVGHGAILAVSMLL